MNTKTKEYPSQKVTSNSNAVMRIKSYMKSPMQIISNVIPNRKHKMEYLTMDGKERDVPKVMTIKGHPIQIKPYATKKPIQNSVVEFLRKVELMKERESKSIKLNTDSMSNINENK